MMSDKSLGAQCRLIPRDIIERRFSKDILYGMSLIESFRKGAYVALVIWEFWGKMKKKTVLSY